MGPLFKKLKKAYGQHTYAFAEDPIDDVPQHVYVSPYYEDDLLALARADRRRATSCSAPTGRTPRASQIPTDFVHDLEGFSDDEIRLVMRDNGLGLITPRKAVAV